jgi:hypothetical protein
MSVPVVAGAYPQPFVRGSTSVLPVGVPRSVATSIARQVHGSVGSRTDVANYIVISSRFPPERVRISHFRDGVQLELGAAIARRLAANPAALRFRFGVAR